MPAVVWVHPVEQRRRLAAMLDALDARELAELRSRCATGEAVRNLAAMEAAARRRERDEADAQALALLRARSDAEVEESMRALDAQWKRGRR